MNLLLSSASEIVICFNCELQNFFINATILESTAYVRTHVL